MPWTPTVLHDRHATPLSFINQRKQINEVSQGHSGVLGATAASASAHLPGREHDRRYVWWWYLPKPGHNFL